MGQTLMEDWRSISQVKKELFDNYGKGQRCPCCEQFVKLYQRPITSAMAYALILIYKYFRQNPTEEWVHVEDYLKSLPNITSTIRGDFAKLSYWGLLERKPGKREDESPRNGFYKITQLGRDFVRRKIEVPRYAYLYNHDCIKLSSEKTDIKKALKEKFDYEKLMLGDVE
jgi:hypothetical protein